MKKPMIFFNIGWMKNYQGENDEDKIISQFGYIQMNGTGHEQYNFLPKNNVLYAYVPLPWRKDLGRPQGISIDRLGASSKDEHIDNVIVVFISKKHYGDKIGTVMVGWYDNAKLYRIPQVLSCKERMQNNYKSFYYATTNVCNAVCLPVQERNIEIPTAKQQEGGYGQKPIWYADNFPELKDTIRKYIKNYKKTILSTDVLPTDETSAEMDQETKSKIEKIAIERTCTYYEKKGFSVTSVEKDNCGWDLTVTKGNIEYFVEVKGTSKNEISFSLTHNEYQNLRKNYQKYKISIVTMCLSKNPILDIYSIEKNPLEKPPYLGVNKKGMKFYLTEYTTTMAFPSF